MEEEKQKKIIYIAVAVIVIIIIGFYIYNWDFVMEGGILETKKLDESWSNFKEKFDTTAVEIKNRVEDVKKSATTTEESARLIQILKNKLENQTDTTK
jgi:hypothetical protein